MRNIQLECDNLPPPMEEIAGAQCLRVDAPAPSLEKIKEFPDLLDLRSSLRRSI
jgi:hypothetical protein